MIDSYICIDTGNSGTKIVYSFPETNKIHSLFMSSALALVSSERMENQLKRSNWIGSSQLEQQAWIKNGDELVAVGGLAERFSPADRRREPKYENALYKVLAAIGVIVEAHQLSKRKQFKIQLGLLLPWDEYTDQKRLIAELTRLSSGYEFRGRQIRVKISSCICYPEGGGIMMSRTTEKGGSWLKKQRLGILMLGDRNCTALYFESGIIKAGASPLIGFSFLLDKIIENSPCLLTREKLSSAIFRGIHLAKMWTTQSDKSGRPLWQKIPSIQDLATARNENLKLAEIEDIDRAITMWGVEWEEKLLNLIQQVFPEQLTELNVGGGSLPFFTPFIKEHFNYDFTPCINSNPSPLDFGKDYTRVVDSAGMTNEVAEALQFRSITDIESAYPSRFADVFCLIKGEIAQGEKRKAAASAKKKVTAKTIKE